MNEQQQISPNQPPTQQPVQKHPNKDIEQNKTRAFIGNKITSKMIFNSIVLGSIIILLFISFAVKNNKLGSEINIVLAIDRSLSMGKEDIDSKQRLAVAKDISIEFLEGLGKKAKIGLVFFSETVISYDLEPFSTFYTKTKRRIRNVGIQEGTAMGKALEESFELLKDAKGKKYIVLISDGQSHSGPDPLDVIKESEHDVKVYTMAIGNKSDEEYNEEALKEIAVLGEGEFYKTSSEKRLKSAFSRINSAISPKLLIIILLALAAVLSITWVLIFKQKFPLLIVFILLLVSLGLWLFGYLPIFLIVICCILTALNYIKKT